MKRHIIVCALDRSAAASPTLNQALALAEWHDAELHVVHVQPRSNPFDLRPVYEAAPSDQIDEADREWLAGLLGAAATGKGVVRSAFYRGEPAAAITAHAATHGADLVVVGSRPYRRLRRYRGSVARAVARTAVCPTLIAAPNLSVARRDAPVQFSEIVCGVDFSAASRAALNRALTLAQESGGRLHAIHVLDGLPNQFLVSGGRAARFAEEFRAIKSMADTRLRESIPSDPLDWCDVHSLVAGGIPHREIVKAADEVRADLIVLGVRPRGVLDEVITGATLPAVLRRASCAVLTVPASTHAAAWPVVTDRTQEPAEYGVSQAGSPV